MVVSRNCEAWGRRTSQSWYETDLQCAQECHSRRECRVRGDQGSVQSPGRRRSGSFVLCPSCYPSHAVGDKGRAFRLEKEDPVSHE